MIATERHNKIIQMINTHGGVRAADIAKLMGVSTETIRKDLIYLNSKGLVQKKFGGAVAVNEIIEQNVDTRSMENLEQKNSIALRALEFIEGNNVLFVDAGSTLIPFAKLLPSERPLAIVTNSFKVIEYLTNTTNSIYFVGGEVSHITMATSGFWASHALNTLKIDVAFLGTSGFQSHTGPCSKLFVDAQFKKEIIKNSKQNIVLADSSKFTSNAIVQYADWADIDILITDKGAPAEFIKTIRKSAEVIIA